MEYPNSATQNPLVSVCIQTYNHAGFIGECIEGILAQERDFPMEIIIGEDDSTDGTREICIQYAKKYPELIRLFLRSEKDKVWINGFKTGRFNFISNLQAANGKYIALCDGDDYWIDPQKLKEQLQILEKTDFAFCATNARYFTETSRTFGPPLYSYADQRVFFREDLVFGNYFATSTILFKRSILDFPDWFWEAPYLDWSLYFSLTRAGKAIYSENITSVYRVHSEGVWNKIGYYQRLLNKISIQHLFLKESNLSHSLKKKIFNALKENAFTVFRFSKRVKDARRYIKYLSMWLVFLLKKV